MVGLSFVWLAGGWGAGFVRSVRPSFCERLDAVEDVASRTL